MSLILQCEKVETLNQFDRTDNEPKRMTKKKDYKMRNKKIMIRKTFYRIDITSFFSTSYDHDKYDSKFLFWVHKGSRLDSGVLHIKH
jgi:hypothetical protein